MKRVNIHDAKTNLSRYLAEGVRKPRIGVAKGEFAIPDSFFEPLPEEILMNPCTFFVDRKAGYFLSQGSAN